MEIRYLFNSVRLNEQEKMEMEERFERIEKLFSNYKDNELKAEVELSVDKKGFFRTEIMIKTPHNLYRADKQDRSLMNSLDATQEAIIKQIRRDKDKMISEQRNNKKEKLE
jgi:ribosomal subunit interface protein